MIVVRLAASRPLVPRQSRWQQEKSENIAYFTPLTTNLFFGFSLILRL